MSDAQSDIASGRYFYPPRRPNVSMTQDELDGLHQRIAQLENENADLRQKVEQTQRDVSAIHDVYALSSHEIEQLLGKALGYPRYCDDPENFPEATEADGVCVGEHTPQSLAIELAERCERQSQAATEHKAFQSPPGPPTGCGPDA